MNFLQKLLLSFGYEKKQLQIEQKPTQIKHGASYVSSGSSAPYSQLGSLAAYVAHPYVYACLSRISQDLAATPLKLIKGKGASSKIIDDHEVIDLLAYPNTSTDQYSFLEQLILDLEAAGNFYILLLGESDKPVSLVRLHPEQVKIKTNQYGVIAYRFNADGEIVDYPADRVVHGKNVTWAMGSAGLYGVGSIQAIQQEIKSDINVAGLVSDASKNPKPDVIISPASDVDIWSEETRKEIIDSYKEIIADGSGVLALSGQAKVDISRSNSPRDVEFQAAREYSKLAITAAFGTPLSVLGEGSANYATARQEAISYWNKLEKRGKKITSALTKIARLFDKDLRFEFDYSDVEALNQMRSGQLERINLHILNGMSVSDAYAFEGLEDAPVVVTEEPVVDDAAKSIADLFVRSFQKKGSVGDVDPTNFPVDGEDKKVSLKNSNWKTFDPEYAEDLKTNFPEIWKAGGNIEGNNQYRRLYPIATRQDQEAKTETEEMAIRKREAWIARHFENGSQFEDADLSPNLSNVAGIVAQIKWLAVGSIGQTKMKEVLNELKAKLAERKEQKRFDAWNKFIVTKQEPSEKMIERAARIYLSGAAKRYAKRIQNNVTKKFTKGITDFSELEAIAEEKKFLFNSIGGQIQKIWGLVGSAELDRVFRIAKKDKPIDLEFSDDETMFEYIDSMTTEISRTTADAVLKSVSSGLIEGKSITEISENINSIAAFGIARSNLIARTESTRAINRSTISAYRQAEEQGLQIKKEWLAARDGNTRATHVDLDGVVIGINEEFETENGSALAPASFGDPIEDCNCRCSITPVVL